MSLENRYKAKDKELFVEVQRLKDGTSQNYNRLYELSEKYIYKIINDIVKNHHTTEDLMQEAYIQIYNKLDSLQEAKAFYVWAGRIATNLTLRHVQKYRKETLVAETEDGDTDFIFEKATDDKECFIPENVLMDREKQRLISEIIDNLSVEQKLSVQYFYYEEMSVRDIAEVMGCSEGTVKSRLNYARKSIKDAVIELDVKHGTRLYSLSSLPLFWLVFREGVELLVVSAGAAGAAAVVGAASMSEAAGGVGMAGAVGGAGVVGEAGGAASAGMTGTVGSASGVATGGAAASGTATSAASAATTGTASKVVGGIGSKILGTTVGKVAVGVVAAAVVTTGGVAVYNGAAQEPKEDNYASIWIYYDFDCTEEDYLNDVDTHILLGGDFDKELEDCYLFEDEFPVGLQQLVNDYTSVQEATAFFEEYQYVSMSNEEEYEEEFVGVFPEYVEFVWEGKHFQLELEKAERGMQFVPFSTDTERYTARYMTEKDGEMVPTYASSMYYLLGGTYSVEPASGEEIAVSQVVQEPTEVADPVEIVIVDEEIDASVETSNTTTPTDEVVEVENRVENGVWEIGTNNVREVVNSGILELQYNVYVDARKENYQDTAYTGMHCWGDSSDGIHFTKYGYDDKFESPELAEVWSCININESVGFLEKHGEQMLKYLVSNKKEFYYDVKDEFPDVVNFELDGVNYHLEVKQVRKGTYLSQRRGNETIYTANNIDAGGNYYMTGTYYVLSGEFISDGALPSN